VTVGTGPARRHRTGGSGGFHHELGLRDLAGHDGDGALEPAEAGQLEHDPVGPGPQGRMDAARRQAGELTGGDDRQGAPGLEGRLHDVPKGVEDPTSGSEAGALGVLRVEHEDAASLGDQLEQDLARGRNDDLAGGGHVEPVARARGPGRDVYRDAPRSEGDAATSPSSLKSAGRRCQGRPPGAATITSAGWRTSPPGPRRRMRSAPPSPSTRGSRQATSS
jgi:hypothetical protein